MGKGTESFKSKLALAEGSESDLRGESTLAWPVPAARWDVVVSSCAVLAAEPVLMLLCCPFHAGKENRVTASSGAGQRFSSTDLPALLCPFMWNIQPEKHWPYTVFVIVC